MPEAAGALDGETFRRALARVLRDPERLALAFQPIVDIGHGMLTGYETLARFDGAPQATPDRWFEAAEAFGVRDELEARVVRKALAARELLPPNCFLSINVGPRSLGSTRVQDAFAQSGDLSGIVIEITEQTPIEDYVWFARALDPLRDAGAALAVDDAGAGHSSLRHITALRPDFVKVDRGLVAALDREPAKAASVEMLGALAGRLDAWVIAEGVEQDSELTRLAQLGVPLAQGFRLGRPAAAMEQLDADTRGMLALLRKRTEGDGVGVLVEPCASLPEDAGRSAIAEMFVKDPACTAVVLLDVHARARSIVLREPFLHGEHSRKISLLVEPISSLRDVAYRAVTRADGERFDPIVCCDERRTLVGIVRMERLVEALAR
jgi:EAL domain-containing protein (putative c-di-GMP-specific phosphodiesterase class I)